MSPPSLVYFLPHPPGSRQRGVRHQTQKNPKPLRYRIPGQLRVASSSLFFSPALAYRPTVRIPLASLAECYEDEDAAPLQPNAAAAASSAARGPDPPAPGADPSLRDGGGAAAAPTARTTVLAAECPEHFLIRPRSPFSRVRRHSVFRFCFSSVGEAGAALGWCRRLGHLAAARAGAGRGGAASSWATSASAAAAADTAMASLVRRLQDAVSFSADDLPGGGSGAAAAAEGHAGSKGGGGGVALGRRVLGRRRRRRKEEGGEEGEEEREASSLPPPSAADAPPRASSLSRGSSCSGVAFECRALRITPLVSEPGRAAVTTAGDLLFKPAGAAGVGGAGGVPLRLPAASMGSGALVSREWDLRDCGLEVFAAPVFDDGYGKEFEGEGEEGGAEGGGRSGGRRRSFDYRASFSRSSPSLAPAASPSSPLASSPLSSPPASPNLLSVAAGDASPEAVEGGGGDRRLRRRRSSLSGNRASSSSRGGARRLSRSAPPSVFLAFESTQDRDAAAGALLASSSNAGAGATCALALDPDGRQARALAAESARSWLSGDISTYAHLLRLNLLSGRSFHDLGKYPVFPWVLSDYESEELDLSWCCRSGRKKEGKDDDAARVLASSSSSTSSSTSSTSSPSPSPSLPPPPFRDLSRPVGALGSNPARLRGFRERYRDLEQLARAVRAGESAAAAAAAAGVSLLLLLFFWGGLEVRKKADQLTLLLPLSLVP